MINFENERRCKGFKLFLAWCAMIIGVVLFSFLVTGGFQIMHEQIIGIVSKH